MRLLAAYRSRHPAWAASISLLLSPALGMFYLARGWLGLFYGAIGVLLAYALPFALAYQAIDYPLWMSVLVVVVYRIAASVHVYLVASRQPLRARYPWYARFYNWILLFWLAPLLLALLVRNLLLQPVTIQSGSMRPALQSGDYFFAEKLTYGLGHTPSSSGSDRSRVGAVVCRREARSSALPIRRIRRPAMSSASSACRVTGSSCGADGCI